MEEEAECAGKALFSLTEAKGEMTNLNWRNVYDNGGVNTLVKVGLLFGLYACVSYIVIIFCYL